MIEPTGPILFIDLLRGAAIPSRKPYEPPTVTDIGTLGDLVHLRDIFSEHAPYLFRLAINGNKLLPCLPPDEWATEFVEDLVHLCIMLRALLARRPGNPTVKVPPSFYQGD